MPTNPCGYRGFSASSVGGRRRLSPMSTTVREEYEVGDLYPVGVLKSPPRPNEPNEAPRSSSLQLAAHWAALHPATQDTGVETFGGAALMADESLGGEGTPLLAPFTPEPFALALGMVPVSRCPADRRRPRRPPPPPAPVETRVPVGGARPAGPTGRPPDPPHRDPAETGQRRPDFYAAGPRHATEPTHTEKGQMTPTADQLGPGTMPLPSGESPGVL